MLDDRPGTDHEGPSKPRSRRLAWIAIWLTVSSPPLFGVSLFLMFLHTRATGSHFLGPRPEAFAAADLLLVLGVGCITIAYLVPFIAGVLAAIALRRSTQADEPRALAAVALALSVALSFFIVLLVAITIAPLML